MVTLPILPQCAKEGVVLQGIALFMALNFNDYDVH